MLNFHEDTYRQFIFYRTYSRWREDLKRRETWEESVQRYIDFMKENLGNKLKKDEYEEIAKYIIDMKVMPSMRLLWAAGDAARKTNTVAYNCSFTTPTKLKNFGEILYLLTCGCGVGFSVEEKFVNQLPVVEVQSGKSYDKFIVPDTREGWADALVKGLDAWYKGFDISFDYSRIRPLGAPLRSMGGRASGPDPLRSLLDFTRDIVLSRQGRKLRPIDVHDIITKIGEVVVAGGTRRSAEISLSDLNDADLRFAKAGQFWETNPNRSMANNSAVYNEKPPLSTFMREWLALMESGSGERGIFNRSGVLPDRRAAILGERISTLGTNPCFDGETLIVTNNGLKRIKELVGVPTTIWNGDSWQEVDNFRITGHNQPMLSIKLHDGSTLRVTPEHTLVLDNGNKIKAGELEVNDKLMVSEVETHGNLNEQAAYLKGFLTGDGTTYNDKPLLWLYNTKYQCEKRLIDSANEIEDTEVNTNAVEEVGFVVAGNSRKRMQGISCRKGQLFPFTNEYKLRLPASIFQWDKKSKSEFIAGIMDADGTAIDSANGFGYQISSINKKWLEDFQTLLKTFNVRSTLRLNKSAGVKDFNDGYGEYETKPLYRLTISQESAIKLSQVVSFSRLISFTDRTTTYKIKPRFNIVVDILPDGVDEKVYCCTVEGNHTLAIGNGILSGQCGEILLQPKQFCNLSEVIARRGDTPKSLKEKIRIAAILGTYQSTLTNFGYLSKEWQNNSEEERLLGVSVTGQQDCPAFRDNPKLMQELRDYAVEINKEYARRFKINPSTSVTAVKPSGTVSQLVNAASGLHPRFSPYYIRRVRISSTDPLFHLLRDSGVNYFPEVGQEASTAHTFVLEFPIASPDGSVFVDDMNVIEQLEYWKRVKENYTEHNPSATIYVKPDEWLKAAAWVYENWYIVGGLSFLPAEDHVYQLAPYQKITKDEYDAMVASMPEIDFDKLVAYESEDNTVGAKESACAGGTCEISLDKI